MEFVNESDVEIILATEENANIIKNIYPLYLYDLSEVYGYLPNEYGIFEEEPIKTLEEQYHVQNIWFEKKDILFPYIIMFGDRPAGFALVSTDKYAPKYMDYYVCEFFLLRCYRGRNIATIAAKQVFDKFHGKWGLYVAPHGKNPRGESFWRKTIKNYTDGIYEEKNDITFDGEKLIFTFCNK